jgi:hypothetical protein
MGRHACVRACVRACLLVLCGCTRKRLCWMFNATATVCLHVHASRARALQPQYHLPTNSPSIDTDCYSFATASNAASKLLEAFGPELDRSTGLRFFSFLGAAGNS